jgi:hypothetical protein
VTIPRTVSPETLDVLPVSDARAVRSRHDLRRVNRVLGTRGIVVRGMEPALRKVSGDSPLRVLELGGGDGIVMLGIARKLSASLAAHLTLLDRLPLVDADTGTSFARLGWSVQTLTVDVFDWAAAPLPPDLPRRWDVIVANLFLHHFEDPSLAELLSTIAARCNLFVACEPRRAPLALIGSHLIGALGVNKVTREDAVLSVHAGFRGAELSRLWPRDHDAWLLQEHAAGPFSHFFRAARRAVGAARTG